MGIDFLKRLSNLKTFEDLLADAEAKEADDEELDQLFEQELEKSFEKPIEYFYNL